MVTMYLSSNYPGVTVSSCWLELGPH